MITLMYLISRARIFMWFFNPKYAIFMWSKKAKYVVKKAKYVIQRSSKNPEKDQYTVEKWFYVPKKQKITILHCKTAPDHKFEYVFCSVKLFQ